MDPSTVLDGILGEIGAVGLAALQHDWGWWSRDKQAPPPGLWRSWGLCTGRGFGKSRAISEWLIGEVMAGRLKRIALIAQNEAKTREVMIDGPSGLIRRSPPWFRPVFELGRLVWPNGAEAFPYTPEVPGALRGPEHDAAWVSEVVVWPPKGRDESFSNLRLGLRLGRGCMLWDTTPKRRHPLVRYLLDRAAESPGRHLVVRGSTRENADNLTADAISEWEQEYGGTQRGREELEGEFLDDSTGAMFRQEWITRARRDMPGKLVRRVLALDPAISSRRATDATGIIEAGLGVDGQVFVLADWSGKHSVDEWSALVIDRYMAGRCDCLVVERNRGGDLLVSLIRGAAQQRGLRVEVVKAGATTRHEPSTIYVREVIGRTGKEERADAIVPLYERGRVSHVNGADLSDLEDTMTTWEPATKGTQASPNDLDALVYAVVELAGLESTRVDHSQSMAAIPAMRQAMAAARTATPVVMPRMVGRGGSRI